MLANFVNKKYLLSSMSNAYVHFFNSNCKRSFWFCKLLQYNDSELKEGEVLLRRRKNRRIKKCGGCKLLISRLNDQTALFCARENGDRNEDALGSQQKMVILRKQMSIIMWTKNVSKTPTLRNRKYYWRLSWTILVGSPNVNVRLKNNFVCSWSCKL